MLQRIRRSDNPNECWGWGGNIPKHGYGQLSLRGVSFYAHRFMYEREIGPIPAGMFVCHHCDNPICSNPRHLFLGTANDNSQDAARKSRMLQKLSIREVIEIKKALEIGVHPRRIARKIRISRHNIEAIQEGLIHKYITRDNFNFDTVPVSAEDYPLIPFYRSKNPLFLDALKAMHSGMGICKASKLFGVNVSMLSLIKNGKYHRTVSELIELYEDGFDGFKMKAKEKPMKNTAIPKRFLTERQTEVMQFIRTRILEAYSVPTLREIGVAMGVTSTNGVRSLISPLFRKGLLVKTPLISRGMSLTSHGKSEAWQSNPKVGA